MSCTKQSDPVFRIIFGTAYYLAVACGRTTEYLIAHQDRLSAATKSGLKVYLPLIIVWLMRLVLVLAICAIGWPVMALVFVAGPPTFVLGKFFGVPFQTWLTLRAEAEPELLPTTGRKPGKKPM
jgi:hypothetical protein